MVGFEKPVQLAETHELAGFCCGDSVLDDWLKKTARKNQRSGASTTYVVCVQGTHEVAGFFSLSAASIVRAQAPGSLSRNQPGQIPAILLGRLAVDQRHGGRGLGRQLFLEAYRVSREAAALVGVRLLLVHAVNEAAYSFWVKHGLIPSPIDPLMLMLGLR